MSGATLPRILWRVTIRLASPATAAALLILFVRALESFEVPALLGLPVGIEVYTSAIYDAIHAYPSEIGLASAYGVALLVITSLCVFLNLRIVGRGSRYATVTGKGFRPRVMRIGRWRYVTAAVFLIYVALVVVLPFLVLLWSSLQRFYSVPTLAALKNLTLDSYRTVLAYPAIGTAVWNSIVLALGSATLIMLATSILCWIVVRTKLPGRALLDNLASLPLVFPGLVLGLGDHGLLPGAADRRVRHDLDHADRLCDALFALRHALQHGLAAAGAQGARGIRRHERGIARHHVRPHRAAAAQTRPDRRLDLHRHRLDPGAGQLDPAL